MARAIYAVVMPNVVKQGGNPGLARKGVIFGQVQKWPRCNQLHWSAKKQHDVAVFDHDKFGIVDFDTVLGALPSRPKCRGRPRKCWWRLNLVAYTQ